MQEGDREQDRPWQRNQDLPWQTEETNLTFGWVDALGSPFSARTNKLTAEEMKAAYSLIERLRRRSPVREIAERLLDKPAQPLESLQPLLMSLIRPNRANWRERQVAAWVMGRAALNAEQRSFAVDTLVQLLQGRLEMDTSEVLRRLTFRAIPFLILVVAATNSGTAEELMAIFTAIASAIFISSAVAMRKQSHRIRATAAASLGHLRDPRSLDALAEALFERGGWFQPHPVSFAAAAALPGVLSTLTSEHYGMIRTDTMQRLCRALSLAETELVLAILNALAFVGDRSVLPAVSKLASGGRAGRNPRIQDAAKLCQARIQARVNLEQEQSTLLRPSVTPAPPDELLRPSAFSTITDPLQLLRAAGTDGTVTDRDSELILAILHDLEQTGDSRALPYVERIANNPLLSPELRQSAANCLPALHARAEVEQMTAPPRLPEETPESVQQFEQRNGF